MEFNERYSRHYSLKGFGPSAQDRLNKASVLVVGAGGLGCPSLQYLVSAGVGKIGIIDHDRIELSNLQRQVLFETSQIGEYKAEVAAEKLRKLNPEINIQEYVLYISTENAVELIEGYDIVVDCTDNFATRYLLGDICMLLDTPLVFGAIFGFEGQVAVFNTADAKGVKTTYRHLFPVPPNPIDAPDCNDNGVIGVLPGIIGVMQASETIKLITDIGQALSNRLMIINLLDNQTFVVDIPTALPETAEYPNSLAEFEEFDYAFHCGIKTLTVQTISPLEFENVCQVDDMLIVDVRNIEEQPKLTVEHLQIPLNQLADNLDKFDNRRIIVVCQEGKRSYAAAQILVEKLGTDHAISHLEGGITALYKYKHEEAH